VTTAIALAAVLVSLAILGTGWLAAHIIADALEAVATAIRTQPAVQIDLVHHDAPEPREPWQEGE
jgi:F0F1-type ATP synthase membrane subunit c/vacuolar-type H+-ATPase subunit K